MPYSISPFFRSPFTDITGGMISHQQLGKCATEEMEMMNCMEAYGLDRGVRKCKALIIDFNECQKTHLQFKRFMVSKTFCIITRIFKLHTTEYLTWSSETELSIIHITKRQTNLTSTQRFRIPHNMSKKYGFLSEFFDMVSNLT